MSRVSVAGLTAGPGEIKRDFVKVPGVDPAWEVPVVIIRGRESGPTVAITSGIHAAEYAPIEAVTQFSRRLDPRSLRGTVIAVLVVNTPGFYERSIYVNPRDGRNLNRAFPGNRDGSPSERVAAFLMSEVIDDADAYVDAHCGDLIEALTPFALWTRTGQMAVDRRSEAMAMAFGLDYVLAIGPESVGGTASGSAAHRGVSSITAEVGQQGICDDLSVSRHVSGLFRVLNLLEMVEEVEEQTPQPTVLREFVWMRTELSGTYHPVVRVGDRVTEGQSVGELRDIFGERLLELHARATGVVVFCVTSLAVKAGDPLMGIGV